MNHKQLHWLEKLHVQLVTVGAVAAVYFLLWPLVRPQDTTQPMVFLQAGWGKLAVFAAAVLLLGALAAALTISSRVEGAMMAMLFGAGGICLRSPQMRPLFWYRQSLDGLFPALAGETVLLACLIAAGLGVMAVVRPAVALLRPRWLWQDPLSRIDERQRANLGLWAQQRSDSLGQIGPVFLAIHRLLWKLAGRQVPPPQQGQTAAAMLSRAAAAMLLGVAVATPVYLLLIHSADRGQVLFALVASFTLGGIVAHQVYPVAASLAAWPMPLIPAMALYMLAGKTVATTGELAWLDVPAYAQALPVDWILAGGAGAVLGFWISARINEAKLFEDGKDQQ